MLTKTRKDLARFHGGKEYRDRKRHLVGLLTTLSKLHNESSALESSPLHGIFSTAQYESIRNTISALHQAIKELATDARQADHIKAQYDMNASHDKEAA